jgi:hypothetical protein
MGCCDADGSSPEIAQILDPHRTHRSTPLLFGVFVLFFLLLSFLRLFSRFISLLSDNWAYRRVAPSPSPKADLSSTIPPMAPALILKTEDIYDSLELG